MADATAQAKEQAQKGAEAKQRIVEDAYGSMGKPTPTQEENDLAALGMPMETHEDDGSGPQPELRRVVTRQSEPGKPSGGAYTTRGAADPKKEPTHPSGSKTS